MTRWVAVVTVAEDPAAPAVGEWLATVDDLARDDSDIAFSQAGRHLRGSRGPGHVTWDLTTNGDDLTRVPAFWERARAAAIRSCETVALDVIESGAAPFAGPRVKRTLLARVWPETDAREIARFEASLSAMPDHIAAIRSWALSRVDRRRSSGVWTHVWEQEFANLDGLQRDYMHHPYHWTAVERWFDPEIPMAIISPDLAHLVRTAPGPVLTTPR